MNKINFNSFHTCSWYRSHITNISFQASYCLLVFVFKKKYYLVLIQRCSRLPLSTTWHFDPLALSISVFPDQLLSAQLQLSRFSAMLSSSVSLSCTNTSLCFASLSLSLSQQDQHYNRRPLSASISLLRHQFLFSARTRIATAQPAFLLMASPWLIDCLSQQSKVCAFVIVS